MSGRIEKLIRQVETDTEEKTSIASAERAFANETEAGENFSRLSEKLFEIERWNSSSGVLSFSLFDENGNEFNAKTAEIGDFIRIKMPASGKADWVKITDVYKNPSEIVLTVQPTYDPTEDAPDKTVTSHFFTAESTNNFCLRIIDRKIEMYVIGLNETSNVKDTNNILESARNLAAANIGHFLGFQKAEWTTFCNNFLENETEK
jgi:hypothetical protein